MCKHPNMFQQAVILAVAAHQDQVDKSGVPYILHPMVVASRCETEDERVVAVLHDIVEDTEITSESLMDLFPDRIVKAVDAITHRKGEPYDQYIERVLKNFTATQVKIQDVGHNMERIDFIKDQQTKERLIGKYKYALEILIKK